MKTTKTEVCYKCNEKPATETCDLFKEGKIHKVSVCSDCEKDWGRDNFFTGK